MKHLKINSQNGYLNLTDLPSNCIFNKVITGCGGTTIVLFNSENYVIAVPTTELIINKTGQECLDDADTDGRGTPFVLETFIINGDHTLTRYLESFIAAEDGAISPLPFNDVTEIMSTKFGISNFDPYHNPDFYNTKSGIIPVYYQL